MDDDELARLQVALLATPDSGAVIPGTGGFRKLRWHGAQRRKGKRGGLRIVYYWITTARQVWLFSIYAKGEVDDLTMAERRALKSPIALELKAMKENS